MTRAPRGSRSARRTAAAASAALVALAATGCSRVDATGDSGFVTAERARRGAEPLVLAGERLGRSRCTAHRRLLPGPRLPFVVAALAFRRFLDATAWLRRHQSWVSALGGALPVLVGVALLTRWWDVWVGDLQQWAAGYDVVI